MTGVQTCALPIFPPHSSLPPTTFFLSSPSPIPFPFPSIALPILTLICFTVGLAASTFLADVVYGVSANVILDSAVKALRVWDFVGMTVKALSFGIIIAIISCSWGVTTTGGAKGVGESTTSAVVISLCCVFVADFVLSYIFFQGGSGDALKSVL